MPTTYRATLTNVGAALVADAIAQGTTLTWAKMALGDGNGSAVIVDAGRTSLVNERYRAPLNDLGRDSANPNTIVGTLVVPPETGGWTIREFGIYDNASTPRLVAYGETPEIEKPASAAGTGINLRLRFKLAVSADANITLSPDSNEAYATIEYVKDNAVKSLSVSGRTITYTMGDGDTHTIQTQDTTYSDVTQSVHGLMSAADKKKLDGIEATAEVNQKAFSNVKVDSTTIAADSKTDTLELAAGNAITLTPDATNDKITITHSSYTARTGKPTTNQTPDFGGTVTISQIKSDTTGHVTEANDIKITFPSSVVTTNANGLMNKNDKSKLDTVENYAGSRLVVTSKYNASNIFMNPPMSNSPTGGVKYTFAYGHEMADQSASPNPNGGAYQVLTFEHSPNRALQIAAQCYTSVGGQNIYFRGRHIDNNDYSLWQQWWRLVKSNANEAVGSTCKPVYLNSSGTLTELSDTVGSSDSPVYFNNGTITSTGKKFSDYLPLSGGTMTNALNFANGTWNNVGDDAKIGDCNIAGALGVKGNNGNSGIALVNKNNDNDYAKISYDGINIVTSKIIDGTITKAQRLVPTSSAANNSYDLSYQAPGTIENIEGANWNPNNYGKNLPPEINTNGVFTSILIGSANDHSNTSTRGFWLLGKWQNPSQLWFGSRLSPSLPDITWQRIVLSNSLVGTIIPYAGTGTPPNALYCDGSAVSRTTYAKLFNAIGTTWGAGNGSTTFNLPDLRGKFLRSAGGNAAAVGGSQEDAMRNLSGHFALVSDGVYLNQKDTHVSGVFSVMNEQPQAALFNHAITTSTDKVGIYFNASNQVTVTNEFRPVNASVRMCIIYQ